MSDSFFLSLAKNGIVGRNGTFWRREHETGPKEAWTRVQKKSRLHGPEPEENFTLYDVFEEGFEICINNPVSAKFLYNAISSVKGIAYLQ